MAKVSVILTSFNHGKYIREAIDSVLEQTFTDYELIIWDDASSDDSWDIINSYSDPRIRAFRNDMSKRGIYGLNKAISEVTTCENIAIHHSDDVWETDKLEKQVAYLYAHSEIGAVFTNALAITEDGAPLTDEKISYRTIFERPNRTRHEWLRFFFNHGNALCHPSVLIRKTCYEDCGFYRYGFAQLGDLDMWVRLCMKYEIHVLPQKLVKFRIRDNQANTSGNRPETRSRYFFEYYEILKIYKNIKKFEELVKIFPQVEQYNCCSESDSGFALAQVFLNVEDSSLHKLIGLEILFKGLNVSEIAEKYKSLYDFDYMQFIELTGKYGIVNQPLADYEKEKGSIYGSRSWRMTRPLRELGSVLRKLKNLFKK
ncbi:MAG: glycosyltransferase [Gammaproteobacteria bacterium]|nr:glycosyltransferase [Gammaproteobacteria bacterium]